MHDVLRERLIRRIESLPDEQVYQVLDFIEFLESKYAERHLQAEASALQKFAENVEDRIRRRAMNPATLREAFQLISAADKVLSNVSAAGRQIVDDLGALGELPEQGSVARDAGARSTPGRSASRAGRPASGRDGRSGEGPVRRPGGAGPGGAERRSGEEAEGPSDGDEEGDADRP